MRYAAITLGQVETAAELVHELDADGQQLRVVKLAEQAKRAAHGGATANSARCGMKPKAKG